MDLFIKNKTSKRKFRGGELYSFKLGKNFHRYDTKNMIYFLKN